MASMEEMAARTSRLGSESTPIAITASPTTEPLLMRPTAMWFTLTLSAPSSEPTAPIMPGWSRWRQNSTLPSSLMDTGKSPMRVSCGAPSATLPSSAMAVESWPSSAEPNAAADMPDARTRMELTGPLSPPPEGTTVSDTRMPRCSAVRSALTRFITRLDTGSTMPLMTIARSMRVSSASEALLARYSMDTSVMPPTAIRVSILPREYASTVYGASSRMSSGRIVGVLTAVAHCCPRSVRSTASAISAATPSCASAVEPPRRGVTMTSSRPTRGWSGGGGSSTKTSRAAPATAPLSSARASARSSSTPPRDTLTMRAPGFMRAKASSPKRRSVVCVSGMCSDTKSARASASSNSTCSTPRLATRSCEQYGSYTTTRMPRPLSLRATS
mmetsp:Transcript_13260/g.55592  ORF Transcript_13260/g.55592 Transcript_13260/m.55592 type:complete len:387 (-) Transcript_13260:553-1713(-)